jgi:hypothetical protein
MVLLHRESPQQINHFTYLLYSFGGLFSDMLANRQHGAIPNEDEWNNVHDIPEISDTDREKKGMPVPYIEKANKIPSSPVT